MPKIHKIIPVSALNDNYIWTIVHLRSQQAVIIDPGEAAPVLDRLKKEQVQLVAILITHHHWDHTNGIAEIVNKYKVPVYGPAKDNVVGCDYPLYEGDRVELPHVELKFDVIEIPGHTLGHIAYLGHGWAFTGDTLFTAGCGRLFEGTPEQLYHSLTRLADLDPQTLIYCAHEYTTANLRFAENVELDNLNLQQRISDTELRRAERLPSVPATIALERQTNPFLRCHLPSLQQAAEAYCGQPLADKVAVFAALRRWKDEF